MAKRSRSVVVYRRARRTYSRSRGGGRGFKIPLAVVASFVPAAAWAIDAGVQGNWGGAGERLLASYTGYEWGQKRFTWMYLNKGLYPLIAGLVAHGVANYFGVNRMIAKLRLPVEI